MTQKIETARHLTNRKNAAGSKSVPVQKRKEDAKKPLYINRI
jgi:hypothetical protein